MRYREFIFWTFGACTLWASAYVGVGYLARTTYEQIAGTLKWGGFAFVAIIVIFMIVVHFGKQRLEIAAEKMIEETKN
jgi:membrane-associated protein